MRHKTRNGVLGRAAKKSGSPRSRLVTAISSDEILPGLVVPRFDPLFKGKFIARPFRNVAVRSSHITQDDFSRASPANRHQITHTTTDDQSRRSTLMRQKTVRVKDGSGK